MSVFEELGPRVGRWLEDEQTLNDRMFSAAVPVFPVASALSQAHRPERRSAWPQQVVWLPDSHARRYGPVDTLLCGAFGLAGRPGEAPLLLHPLPPAALRRVRQRRGCEQLADTWATPTSSYRSVLAARPQRQPVVLKLALGARIGNQRRRLDERQISAAVLISRALEMIPEPRRRSLGLDWFPEPGGVVDVESGMGWLLRRLPDVLNAPTGGRLVPSFSLTARGPSGTPLLVELIRRDGGRPEDVVVEQVLRPYVRVVSYLLLMEGIAVEGHGQNVLFEMGDDERMTGRVVLRDLSDMSISVALRLARRRPLPALDRDLPTGVPFSLASSACDHTRIPWHKKLAAGQFTVETYGLNSFVWVINQTLAGFFSGYDAEYVDRRYLELWRDAIMRALPVRLSVEYGPQRLATDEAIESALRRVDWPSLGSVAAVALPEKVERLMIGGSARRSGSPVYDRLDCAWGEVYLKQGLPVFFRPAR